MERVVTAIPLVLVIEILSWLPARSLVRFRRVCKLWLSITSDPLFIDTNLDRRRKSHPPSVLLFRSHEDGDHCGIIVVDDDPKRTPDRLLIVPRSPNHRQHPLGQLRMSSPCNGLVCISDVYGFIELLNPTTGERHIPPPHHPGANAVILPSLGFHPETKEYKVVRFFYLHFDGKWRMKCEVYTLGTNSWRQIPYPYNCIQISYPHNCIPHYKGPNANGALYWQIDTNGDYDPCGDVLVSFDLKNESFALVSPPDFARVYPEKRYLTLGVMELQGSVCIRVFKNSPPERTDIWMMTVSSNTHEWALKYSVSCFITDPLFIHNEKILVKYCDCYRSKFKDKEDPPALVYHHFDCKDGCTTEVYRERRPETPLIYHYLKGQDGNNFQEFYRNTGIHSSEAFAHVESLVSLPNQSHL